MSKIKIGSMAGHHFNGQADMTGAWYAQMGDLTGFYLVRKRLVDRPAFKYDSRLGWEYDRWFEWDEDNSNNAVNGE